MPIIEDRMTILHSDFWPIICIGSTLKGEFSSAMLVLKLDSLQGSYSEVITLHLGGPPLQCHLFAKKWKIALIACLIQGQWLLIIF